MAVIWILFSLVDSAVVVYGKYVRSISREEEAALWQDYRVIGRLFGLSDLDMPGTLDELERYRRDMLDGDRLHVSRWARDRARKIVLEPPVPLMAQPLLQTVNFITIALLPDDIREQYGFSSLPPTIVRKALVAGGAAYGKRAVLPLLPGRLRLVPAARASLNPRPARTPPSARPSASNATSRTSSVANSVTGGGAEKPANTSLRQRRTAPAHSA
jgi:uncharacterized protein (DUF2236 family)